MWSSHVKRVFHRPFRMVSLSALTCWLGSEVSRAESCAPASSSLSHTLSGVVASPVERKSSTQGLVKKWRVVLDGHPAALQLAVSVPTMLFVRRDQTLPSRPGRKENVVVRLQFTSNCEQSLDAIAVETQEDNALSVDFEPPTDVQLDGLLMGELFLPPGVPMTSLSLRGDTVLVIEDENVFPDAFKAPAAVSRVHPFTVNVLDDAKVLVSMPQHRWLRFQSMKINTMGKSVMQLDVPGLRIDKDLSVNSTGDSQVTIRSKTVWAHGHVTANLLGEANLRIAASSLHLTKDLGVTTLGNTKVYFGAKPHQSSCQNVEISSFGDATIDLGALTCANASVSLRGDTKVALHVTDTLQVQAGSSDASVQIVGRFPKRIEPLSSTSCQVKPAANYHIDLDPSQSDTSTLQALPAHVPVRLRGLWGGCWVSIEA